MGIENQDKLAPSNLPLNIDNYMERLGSQGLVLITDLLQLGQFTGTGYEVFANISRWINDVNRIEEMAGKPETMIPRSVEQIANYVEQERAVILMEKNERGDYVACGFCALPYDLLNDDPGKVFELGTLIRSAQTKQRNIGALATLGTLDLPKAQGAEAIIAYANNKSLPLFLRLGARVLESSELKEKFPYLPEYSGDLIVDLTSLRRIST